MIRILWLVKAILICVILFAMELTALTQPEDIQVIGYRDPPICVSWKTRKKIEKKRGIDYGHMRKLHRRIDYD